MCREHLGVTWEDPFKNFKDVFVSWGGLSLLSGAIYLLNGWRTYINFCFLYSFDQRLASEGK